MQNIFTKRQLRLQAGDVLSLQVTRPVCLHIGSGRVWVTIEGGSTDYWLSGGQSLDIPGQGLVVIESVGAASKLQVGLCRRHWAVRLKRGVDRLSKALIGLVQRFGSYSGSRSGADNPAAKLAVKTTDRLADAPGSCSQ